ncbi:potential glycosyl hydrolase [Pseudozyma hubeiensis SY62]|uniref:glucan endo-1,3-beta-D-glucosidase n=1 Tax=Pseudozyma hubeiensis (strain SY62) TaxID=1305764 RepID=R9P877_PSEHS|nr:potential glycosyl hydrolase [Pseudozyma hubeiensis SY62]GAC94280.1 potential glycosyl hydrolase [Pseudozyma hubeiensis SY62]
MLQQLGRSKLYLLTRGILLAARLWKPLFLLLFAVIVLSRGIPPHSRACSWQSILSAGGRFDCTPAESSQSGTVEPFASKASRLTSPFHLFQRFDPFSYLSLPYQCCARYHLPIYRPSYTLFFIVTASSPNATFFFTNEHKHQKFKPRMASPYSPRLQGGGGGYARVASANMDDRSPAYPQQPQYYQHQQYGQQYQQQQPYAQEPDYDAPTPALAADSYSPEYSMEDMRKPTTPGSHRFSIASYPRDFADPDAGWTEKRQSGTQFDQFTPAPPVRSRKKMMLYIGGAVLALVLIIATVAGIVVARHRDDSNRSSSSSNASTNSQALSGDPSKFKKNSALHNSFWGMCYTPFKSQYQYGCGVDLASVVEDVQTLSQLTTRVRLYGADCNVTALMLDAIQRTKVNLTIYPAIYLDSSDPGDVAWTRQVNNITFALDNFGTNHIGGISVGNEYLLNGGSATNLLAYVQQFRTLATSKSWTFPIGTADAGSMFTATVAAGVDYFMANVHAWFAGTLVSDGPAWTYQYFEDNDANIAAAAPNTPAAYIAETGWPSGANSTAAATYVNEQGQVTGAKAGVPELQTFLDGYVCDANKNGTGYFWFELYDEQWKDALYGGVEAHWGLFDQNKKLKQITIPNCSHN